MIDYVLTKSFLSPQEQQIFTPYLHSVDLDPVVWGIFETLFDSATIHTQPVLLKAYEDKALSAACILIRCTRYGRTIFRNEALSTITNLISIPFYLWVNYGCGMDMLSNTGFYRNPQDAGRWRNRLIDYLQKHKLLTIINDYSTHSDRYMHATELPALPHGLINTRGMSSVNDYLSHFRNIKKKQKVFSKKGGTYYHHPGPLNDEQLESMARCFRSTAQRSIFYLPYQDLYLRSAMSTSRRKGVKVHHFIATLHDEIIGYQAAIECGKYLNALHGAFDRSRKTTYHAYDLLFVEMVKYALENHLELIDFGAVINHTKQKMVNEHIPSSYFIMSRSHAIKTLFSKFLRFTRIQQPEQLKFRSYDHRTGNRKVSEPG